MKNVMVLFLFGLMLFPITDAFSQQTIGDIVEPKLEVELQDENNNLPGEAVILVYSNTSWSGITSGDDLGMSSTDGSGDARFTVSCEAGFATLAQGNFQKSTERGYLAVIIIQYGNVLAAESTNAAFGIAHASAECLPLPSTSPGESTPSTETEGGGCLIATAAYGSEMAPKVQQLRELRDSKLLQTESGRAFMGSFNGFYYSFSPAIADYERENPAFRELVKIVITPMVLSLSLLNHVDMDSEVQVLGYGISLILLNVGMYIVAPVMAIRKIKLNLCS